MTAGERRTQRVGVAKEVFAELGCDVASVEGTRGPGPWKQGYVP